MVGWVWLLWVLIDLVVEVRHRVIGEVVVVFVFGEFGVGKTRLLVELCGCFGDDVIVLVV